MQSKWCIKPSLRCCLIGLFGWLMAQSSHAQNENFKLGGFLFDLSATFSVTYNDNINYAEFDPEWDIILQPGVGINGRYQISELNTFSVDLGIAYQKYIRNPELDSINNFLTIAPNSKIALTVFIEDVTLEFYDELYYSVDAADSFGFNGAFVNTNPIDYGRFVNEAGVDMDWDLKDLVIFANFNRYDVIPTSSDFDYTRRHAYTFSGGPRFMVAENLTIGATASVQRNEYEENVNNNSWNWMAGPMAIWQASENWSFSGNIAYQEFYFDDTGSINDNSQPQGLVGALTVNQRVSSVFEHSLSLSHNFDFGYLSNIDSVFALTYGFNWRMNSVLSPRGNAYYEIGSDSGGSSFNFLGFPVSTAEDYHRYGVGVGVDYQLSSRITTSFDYNFSHKSSNLYNRSYYQNLATVSVRYDF